MLDIDDGSNNIILFGDGDILEFWVIDCCFWLLF
jgi:hypothetical protein